MKTMINNFLKTMKDGIHGQNKLQSYKYSELTTKTGRHKAKGTYSWTKTPSASCNMR